MMFQTQDDVYCPRCAEKVVAVRDDIGWKCIDCGKHMPWLPDRPDIIHINEDLARDPRLHNMDNHAKYEVLKDVVSDRPKTELGRLLHAKYISHVVLSN